MSIFWGTILVIVGTLMVIFARKIFNAFGRIPWAEEHIGPTGTLSLIRIVGIVLILVGFFLWTGLFGAIFGPILRTLFGGLEEPLRREQELRDRGTWLAPFLASTIRYVASGAFSG
jgi:hypothetical protein